MARPNDSIKNMMHINSAGRQGIRHTKPLGRLDMKLRRDDSTMGKRSGNPSDKRRITQMHSPALDLSGLHTESNRSTYRKKISDVIDGDGFKVRTVWNYIVCCVSPLK